MKPTRFYLFRFYLLAFVFSILTVANSQTAAKEAAAPQGPAVIPAYIDHSVKPGDDFFLFANGDWIKDAKMPADRSFLSPGSGMVDETDKRVADLITSAGKSGAKGRKIADLYQSYMDEAGLEAKGLTQLKPHLDTIAAIHDK